MTGLKVVFAGTPGFGIPCLNAIHNSPHTLVAVYTQPDRQSGRGRTLQGSAVKSWALDHQVPVMQPLNFKTQQSIDELAALKPDVMVVIAYGLLLPPSVLSIPRFGCINVHGSLLPRWRGASPIQQAILHGDPVTGICIMQMDKGMDTGPVLASVPYTILPTDTSGSLQEILSVLAVDPLLSVLGALQSEPVVPVLQDDQYVTYAPKITKQDARIDWQQSAAQITQQIRAFNPAPIAWTQWGNDMVRIYSAHREESTHAALAGTVLSIGKHGLRVVAGDGHVVCIETLQLPGGQVMPVQAFSSSSRAQALAGQVFQ